MTRGWEETFREWSKPSGDTEKTKCQNAERMIGDAIRESAALAGKTIEVFAHGSYGNATNVRQDSDVDICVCCTDFSYFDFSIADGFGRSDVGIVDTYYTCEEFKNEVEGALVAKFGRRAVVRGNKAFDVHENTYRVEADVVACFEHRRYTRRDYGGQYRYLSGVEFRPDSGGRIINWPRQNYDNGVMKNTATGNRFKYITRVLKRLRNEMADSGIVVAKLIPSYLIECLVWNVPNHAFRYEFYSADVWDVLAHTFNGTLSDEACKEWGEVNELKYLFGSHQPWIRALVHSFLDAAWSYVGFE